MRPFKIEGGCPNEVCVPRRPLSPNPSLDETGRPYDLPDDQEGMRRATRIPPAGQRRGCVSNMTGSCWERTEESGEFSAPALVGVGAATKRFGTPAQCRLRACPPTLRPSRPG